MDVIHFFMALAYFFISAKCTSLGYRPVNTDGNNVGRGVSMTASPCNITFSGKWADSCEIILSPNPPQHNQPLKVHFEITAVEDLWFATARGNISMIGHEWSYSFDAIICDGTMNCPIKKGETRVYEKTILPSPSKFLEKGLITAWAEVFNQDDEMIIMAYVPECPI